MDKLKIIDERVRSPKRFPGRAGLRTPISTYPAIVPRTIGQRNYVEAIQKHDIVFGIGPAGTGKTYLAVAMAVAALKKEQVSRIVLTRPAVEEGEALGFLPGDLQEKITPYLRPLYDSLNDMLDPEEIERVLPNNVAVVGIPSAHWGEVIVAVSEGAQVTAEVTADFTAEVAAATAGLARYKQPRACLTIEKLPRSLQGKIQRTRVRELVLARYAMADGPYPKFEPR